MHKASQALSCLFLVALLLCGYADQAEAADLIVVGDTSVKLSADIISGIRKSLRTPLKVYTSSEIKGNLNRIVEREDARVVIVLGREALAESQRLPTAVSVIYSLVLTPPASIRANTTGFYMAAPAREYANLIRKYLHSIKKIAVLGTQDQLKLLAGDDSSSLNSYNVNNSVELVETVKKLDDSDAFLILPNVSLLTSTAMEEASLFSFRKGIPMLGVSEKQVNDGALFSLVVDTVQLGKTIGEYAAKALHGGQAGQSPPSPPKRFDLYLNTETARKMGIQIPAEMLKMAKRVYP